MVDVDVVGVRLELPNNNPIVLLRERAEPQRLLPIFIGGPEATAIALALDGVETPRPMTHDLIVEVLGALAATVEKVVVTELRDRTFFAELHLAIAGATRAVSSRPSDAIALAVRVGCPVQVDASVLDQAGYLETGETGDDDTERVVEEFRDFIDQINPGDFET